MPNLGPVEIIAILVIVFLLFGATRLPKLGKSMGQSIRGFKQGLEEGAPPETDEEKAAKSDAAKLEKGDPTDKS
ncbi:MAG TPA: twin-arginine translocase TatA/TatE family subunit [Thermoleophilia bacterium]|jgi:sec-independent protein translocase protein TatA